MSTVENIMLTPRASIEALITLWPAKHLLRHTAIIIATELYTWILGKMFVGVSVAYRFLIRSIKMLSWSNVLGLRL